VLRSKVQISDSPAATDLVEPPAYRERDWRLAGIRAGLPQVYPETYETFVAQMLNLDLLGGVAFEKGCYTGQEIIARTHFRGAIKRRMFRFECASAPPPPGTRVLVGEQHAGEVVDAAATDAGCELLAVVSLAQQDAELELESSRGARIQKLPLPYSL
jgi:folate-binding protein YgfZ